jgi:hypothetical protein
MIQEGCTNIIFLEIGILYNADPIIVVTVGRHCRKCYPHSPDELWKKLW